MAGIAYDMVSTSRGRQCGGRHTVPRIEVSRRARKVTSVVLARRMKSFRPLTLGSATLSLGTTDVIVDVVVVVGSSEGGVCVTIVLHVVTTKVSKSIFCRTKAQKILQMSVRTDTLN